MRRRAKAGRTHKPRPTGWWELKRPPRPVRTIKRIRPRKWVEVVLRMPVDANLDVDLKVTDLGRPRKK